MGFGDQMRSVTKQMQKSNADRTCRASRQLSKISIGHYQSLSNAGMGPVTVQLVTNGRALGEVVLPTVARGMAVQRLDLAVARG